MLGYPGSFYYKKAEDTYYQANNWAAYDDWRRARDQWDYFYSRAFPLSVPLPNFSPPPRPRSGCRGQAAMEVAAHFLAYHFTWGRISWDLAKGFSGIQPGMPT